MNLSHVHNKYRKPSIGVCVLSTEYQTLSNRLLRRLEMVRIALLFVIFVGFTGIANSQTYDPTICDFGDTTAWDGPITAWAIGIPANVIGCADSNCIVSIIYYERFVQGGWEFQIAEISFQDCDSACMVNAWKCAYWMLAMKNQAKLGIENLDDCSDVFWLKAATCWQHIQYLAFNRYRACGGECCIGMYRICRYLGPSGEYFSFTQITAPEPGTNNCEEPCEFTDCDGTMPPSWIVDVGTPIGGNLIPKLSIYESIPSKNINFHPNPTDGNVIVSFDLPEKGIYTISVFDNLGNEIFKQEINSGANLNIEFELKSNAYPAGMFNVLISCGNGEIMNGKFVKIK